MSHHIIIFSFIVLPLYVLSKSTCKLCSSENTLTDGSFLTKETGLLIAGGFGAMHSTEFWAQEFQCKLPPLSMDMDGQTMDTLQGKIVTCFGGRCDQLTGSGWEQMQRTLYTRRYHTSAVTSQGILLVGGSYSPSTVELMPVDGGESMESFTLEPGRDHHCSIQVSDSTIILTGGQFTESLVTEHSGLMARSKVTTRELPSLNTGRSQHACGMYTVGGNQMLIVTGGQSANYQDLSSTEITDYTSRTQGWREVEHLPSPRYGLRGASVASVFHVTGGDSVTGWIDDILSWDPVSESWAVAGYLIAATSAHAVTEVPLTEVTDYCLNLN